MTKTERDDLSKLCRQREKLAKVAVDVLASKHKADFQKQLAARYSYYDDAVWKQANELAQAAAAHSNVEIATQSEALGIPRKFAPSLTLHWNARGENECNQRRTELTRVAYTEIDHATKAAKFRIEQSSVDIQTQLITGSLASAEARAFLEAMPSPEQLMPTFTVQAVEEIQRKKIEAART
jgi:hypothetical protein